MIPLKIILILALLTVGANLISQPDDLSLGTGLLMVLLGCRIIYSLYKSLRAV